VASIVSCLQRDTAAFWSRTLGTPTAEPVVLSPTAAQLPAGCLDGLDLDTAFFCPDDGTIYVTAVYQRLLAATFTGTDFADAWAALLAHEIGHVVQRTVHQPGIDDETYPDALSRSIEQQADCLSGVWAASQVAAHRLDADRYVAVAQRLVALKDTEKEIRTHGTPVERAAQVRRGLAGGSPKSCGLAGFR
jgi:uncharacterized protein